MNERCLLAQQLRVVVKFVDDVIYVDDEPVLPPLIPFDSGRYALPIGSSKKRMTILLKTSRTERSDVRRMK